MLTTYLFAAQFVAREGCLLHSNVIFQQLLGHILIHQLGRLGFPAEFFEVLPNELLIFLHVHEIYSFHLKFENGLPV